MQGPAQTLDFMIAGYTVIFGVMIAYAASLAIRFRSLRRREQELKDLLDE